MDSPTRVSRSRFGSHLSWSRKDRSNPGIDWVPVSATAGVTAKVAGVVLQRQECVFQPGLADLFEALIIVSAAAHSIEILRNNRVIGMRQRKPIERLVAVITRSCSHSQPDKMIYSVVSVLLPSPAARPQ